MIHSPKRFVLALGLVFLVIGSLTIEKEHEVEELWLLDFPGHISSEMEVLNSTLQGRHLLFAGFV